MSLQDLEKNKEVSDTIEIKRAGTDDLQTVWSIIEQDAQWLAGQGLNHWAKYYSEEMVSKMIAKKEVYIGLVNGNPVGTITLDTNPPKYYAEAGYAERFTNPDDPAIYVTAAAVLPNEQRKGFAGKLLQFVEERSKQISAKWMRLDCRAEALTRKSTF